MSKPCEMVVRMSKAQELESGLTPLPTPVATAAQVAAIAANGTLWVQFAQPTVAEDFVLPPLDDIELMSFEE